MHEKTRVLLLPVVSFCMTACSSITVFHFSLTQFSASTSLQIRFWPGCKLPQRAPSHDEGAYDAHADSVIGWGGSPLPTMPPDLSKIP